MPKSDIIIRIGGEGGEGVISTGDMFTIGAARTGFHVFTFRTYPAEIKGGHAWYQIRVSDRPVLSMGDGVDVLIAYDLEAYERHAPQVNDGGVIIYDSERVKAPEALDGRGIITYAIPLQKMAREELDFQRGKNVLALGVMAGLFGLSPSGLENLVRARLHRRAELLEKNLKSLHHGYEFTQTLQKQDGYYLGTSDHVSRLVMSGNDAIVAGALQAGCRFFAGYPITPASEILEAMARELPRIGGAFMQAEDEMAAFAAVVGASSAGLKAMTATSGPGFSLMTEILGLASMAEVPCVVVDAQRAGPSTGMPTKLEQADLFMSLYGGHGDFPRLVLAPASVEDCMFQTVHAFNLAERYQMPAIFLSDQSLSHRTQSLDWPDIAGAEVWDRIKPNGASADGEYRRFALTESGVSPMAVPGQAGHAFVAPGLEHDETGHPDLAPETHEAMTRKRFRKLEFARRDLEATPRYGVDDPEIGIVGWGATEGAIIEAVQRANAAGYRVAAMHPRVLNPLPDDVAQFAGSVRRLIVPEVNYQGQFAHHLAALLGVRPINLTKYGGLPFTPGEIFAKIEEVGK